MDGKVFVDVLVGKKEEDGKRCGNQNECSRKE